MCSTNVGGMSETNANSSEASKMVCLPPGVPSVEAWGQTLISAGRFKGADMSYAELLAVTEPSTLSYKHWCRAHAFTLHGAMRDLAQYLLLMHHEDTGNQIVDGPLIPGSDLKRQYKKAK